jgi:hypothetical protein
MIYLHDLEGYDATWKVIKKENSKQRHPIRFGAIKIAIIPAVGAHCMRPYGWDALKKIPTPEIAPLTHHRFITGHPNRGAPRLGAAFGRVQRVSTGDN